ncbi:MAG: ester cyclase [Burkholderiaceae bacterium]|nr:ester cyclase [Burkholderiaceae bacterium]
MHDAVGNEASHAKKAVFRRLVDIYAAGDLSALDEVIARDYVGHASAGDRDLDGFRQSILHFHNLFVYARDSFQVDDQLVDGDKVATRMTAHVKVRATGEPVTLIGINIARIVDGKIVEEWNTWEQLQNPKPQDKNSEA